MSVLAYSELLRRIAGIDEKELETPFRILNRNNTTQNRLRVLKALADHEPISIGALLQKLHQPRGGGSYITIKRYFRDLEKEGLLKSEKKKNIEVWSFGGSHQLLKRFILG